MEITPAISAAPSSRAFYVAYLNSPAWRMKRNDALKRSRWHCERCPSKRDLQVHHKSYERLGAELTSDLEVLCPNCHRGEHLSNPEQTSLSVYLRLASAAVHADPFATIADLSDAVKTECAKLKIAGDTDRINSALSVVSGNRLKTAQPPQTQEEAMVRVDDYIDKNEARAILCRMDTALGGGFLGLVDKLQMPHAAPANQHAVARLKAAQMISREIIESIVRCEKLEREAAK